MTMTNDNSNDNLLQRYGLPPTIVEEIRTKVISDLEQKLRACEPDGILDPQRIQMFMDKYVSDLKNNFVATYAVELTDILGIRNSTYKGSWDLMEKDLSEKYKHSKSLLGAGIDPDKLKADEKKIDLLRLFKFFETVEKIDYNAELGKIGYALPAIKKD